MRVARPPTGFPVGAVYLEPCDRKDITNNAANLRAVKKSCMQHGYTLQLQLHKLLDME